MRTTINISDALLSDLKARAAERKKPFRQILEETLQRGLAASEAPASWELEIQAYPVGIKKAYHGMSMNQIYDQIEAEDIRKVSEP